MPKKLKKSKLKKKASVPVPDPTEEPQTDQEILSNPVPGQQSDQGIMKKKKKKKKQQKLTKEEKKLAKLEKASKEFQSNTDEYERFLDRMDVWLKDHHRLSMELFSAYDMSGRGILSSEDFQLGMKDLGIPCVEVQLHILTKLLDHNNNGSIDYVELGTGLQKARFQDSKAAYADEGEDLDEGNKGEDGTEEERDPTEEAEPVLEFTKEKLEPCAVCQLGLWKPLQTDRRFIFVKLRLITFDNVKSHPGHFEEVVRSSIKVYGLIKRIREYVGIESTKLKIFKDKTCSQQSFLPPGQSLEECGFAGGPRQSPYLATLYYDYTVDFHDSPIVNCDHYFGFRGQ
ncbi:uncharacterized protein LOC117423768 isoform X1 [Acipenser ruthenus]|uniref:uncharacterized protein LOC117423768 isoform X1 n=1 Tax=Acipenser ruthenus TaxID=7906 RepID=UPI002741B9E4|nr:uncharacterized protein LOC117423768 isoform X1 [Acipenser ruthenus]